MGKFEDCTVCTDCHFTKINELFSADFWPSGFGGGIPNFFPVDLYTSGKYSAANSAVGAGLCNGYNYDSTSIQLRFYGHSTAIWRPHDCLSKATELTVT